VRFAFETIVSFALKKTLLPTTTRCSRKCCRCRIIILQLGTYNASVVVCGIEWCFQNPRGFLVIYVPIVVLIFPT
jgi:hypothetical protein